MIGKVFELNWANGVGAIALLLHALILMRKNEAGMRLMLAGVVALWALHYQLMGATAGMVSHVVGAAALLTAHYVMHTHLYIRAAIAAVVVVLCTAIVVLFWQDWTDILIILGMLPLTYGQYLARGVAFRLSLFSGSILYITYALAIGSMPGTAVNIVNAASSLIGLWREQRVSTKDAIETH